MVDMRAGTRRLLRAMATLAEPGTTVLDVACSVGFDSVSAFTRAFKRYVDETPTAYRRRATATPTASSPPTRHARLAEARPHEDPARVPGSRRGHPSPSN
jgi:AraC-like DNA-binding protein